jgi:ribonuclease P protein component
MAGCPQRARAMQSADFERATRQGRRCATEHFLLFAFRRDDELPARLGITVTRKVGKAVPRNRIKRLVREWFRRRQGELGASDLVVIAKRGLPRDLPGAEASRELDQSLGRLAPWRSP